MQKIIAYCRECGQPAGIYDSEDELRLKIAEQKNCVNCDVGFGFLSDGRIWNLEWDFISIEGTELNNSRDFWPIIHKSIVEVSREKFENGYYADAVESAFKEINSYVKGIVWERKGEELDGRSLMFSAFGGNDPTIILDALSTETGRNIQEGYMHIFAGAMQGIRNHKAHENIDIREEEAIHFIFLASMLMHKLDKQTTK